jgi:hypothetical protein
MQEMQWFDRPKKTARVQVFLSCKPIMNMVHIEKSAIGMTE